jgi:hypothetical protein
MRQRRTPDGNCCKTFLAALPIDIDGLLASAARAWHQLDANSPADAPGAS